MDANNLGHTLPTDDVIALGAGNHWLVLNTCCPLLSRTSPWIAEVSGSGYQVKWPGPFTNLYSAWASNCETVTPTGETHCVSGLPISWNDTPLPEPNGMVMVFAGMLTLYVMHRWFRKKEDPWKHNSNPNTRQSARRKLWPEG